MNGFKHAAEEVGMGHQLRDTYKLRGFDTFSSEWYDLEGEYDNEAAAKAAAKHRLANLERTQPARTSGGQNGIQDRVFIVRPDGSQYRYSE